MGADWQKIKTEYITTGMSYRCLAKKYGLNQATVAQRGKKENWVGLREQSAIRTQAKIQDSLEHRKVARAERLQSVADKLLSKLEKAVEELDLDIITVKEKFVTDSGERTEESRFAREGGIVDRNGLRQITAALKDLKEIQMIRPRLDEQEQEARIRNLNRQADRDEKVNEAIQIIMGDDAERCSI